MIRTINNSAALISLLLITATIHAQTTWTLQQCIDRALEKNITINESKLGNEINRLTLDQSKANRLPNLNFSDGQNLSYGRSVDPFSNQYVDQNVASNNMSLSSSVTLYNGRQNENTIRQNQLNYEAGKADIDVSKNDISLNIVAAYLQVLFAYEQLDNAVSQVEATVAEADRTKKYVDSGKFPESNLFQVQSQLATDKLAEVTAQNQLQVSKVTLMQLIELPVTDSFGIVRPAVNEIMLQTTPHSASDVYQIAMAIMPEVKSASMKSQSGSLSLTIARNMQLPKLTLTGSLKTGYSSARNNYSYQTQILNEPIGYLESNPSEIVLGQTINTTVMKEDYPFMNQFSDNFSQLINLNLSVPIFNNKLTKTSIEKAKINTQVAGLEEQRIKNQLRKSIELALTDLKASEKKYAATIDQYNAAQLSYQNMEKKFNLGMVSSTDFLVEKNNYIKAKSNVVQSKYDYLFKIKVVDYYTGKPITF